MEISLSKIILFASLTELANFLSANPNIKLDEIDEYGYTPLIEAIIVNSLEKTELLLKAGAKIDVPDLTGRTALFWAAQNNRQDLVELLLFNGANPNAYTYAGESAFVPPILNHNEKIIDLFKKYKANFDFALDFINAKMLGHRFSLEGRTVIFSPDNYFVEMELEGFYQDSAFSLIFNSLKNFRLNFGGKRFNKYFGIIDLILNALEKAQKLLHYRHYLYLLDIERYKKEIYQIIDEEKILIIPVAFEGHAITFIKIEEYFIRCDRGAFGKENGAVVFYKALRNITSSEIHDLIFKKQSRNFIDNELVSFFDLQVISKMDLPLQMVGNCSFANTESIVPALLFLFTDDQEGALRFFNTWIDWDKSRELFLVVSLFKEDEKREGRLAAKAELLAVILFQALSYESKKDFAKVGRIFKILSRPQYRYILESYLKVFSDPLYQKDYENLKQLINVFQTA